MNDTLLLFDPSRLFAAATAYRSDPLREDSVAVVKGEKGQSTSDEEFRGARLPQCMHSCLKLVASSYVLPLWKTPVCNPRRNSTKPKLSSLLS